jgi:hypothetical protein
MKSHRQSAIGSRPFGLLTLAVFIPVAGRAQAAPPVDQLVSRFAAMTAVLGYEQAMADTIASLVPRARRDAQGSLTVPVGAAAPATLVACRMGEPGYVVGNIRDDGWLTLRRVGPLPNPLYDQALEGQRVTGFGGRGAVPAVVAVRSVHLARGRAGGEDAPFSVDDALVDVGAASRAEAEALGIQVLSPVALAKRPQRYGDSLLAAPAAGRRAACAALVTAALAAPPGTGAVAAFVASPDLSGRATLATIRQRYPGIHRVVLVEPAAGPAGQVDMAQGKGGEEGVELLRLPVRYQGTAVETVSIPDVERVVARLEQVMGGDQ